MVSGEIMIIIITGASHTGKTALSQKLLKKLKFPYISIDHLKMGLIRSGQTELTPYDDDKMTGFLWPILREIIKTAIENEQNLIVEGCYIPFDWRKSFDEKYFPFIRFICLAMTDEYIENNFNLILHHRSDIERRTEDFDFTKAELKKANKAEIDGFKSVGERVVLIKKDYEKTIKNLLENFDFKGL